MLFAIRHTSAGWERSYGRLHWFNRTAKNANCQYIRIASACRTAGRRSQEWDEDLERGAEVFDGLCQGVPVGCDGGGVFGEGREILRHVIRDLEQCLVFTARPVG